ncbi:MAG: hypothetical protein O2800_01520 [Planctomycetota bacterium]|nr:hypothetical protein [Planctomycetota bacterium]
MLVDVREPSRKEVVRVEIDPSERPVSVEVQGRRLLLHWDIAQDDAGHLRKCVVCGAGRLYCRRNPPRATMLLLALTSVAAGIFILGYSTHPAMWIALGTLLVYDIAALVFGRTSLCCYRCHSEYRATPIARWHRAWDPISALRCSNSPARPHTLESVDR